QHGEMLLGEGCGQVPENQREESAARERRVAQSVAEGLAHGEAMSLTKSCWIELKRQGIEALQKRGGRRGFGHERPPWGSSPRERAEETAASRRLSSAARALWPRSVSR